MNTTIRFEGKRHNIEIPEKDRLASYRLVKKLNFDSYNGLITWLIYKYEDDRQFLPNFAEYVRYCIKRELKK